MKKQTNNETVEQFQSKRIQGCEELTDMMTELARLMQLAEQITADYYEKNPKSWAVLFTTDDMQERLREMIEAVELNVNGHIASGWEVPS